MRGVARETLPWLRDALAAAGVIVIGEFSFSTKDLQDPRAVGALVVRVTGRDAAGATVRI